MPQRSQQLLIGRLRRHSCQQLLACLLVVACGGETAAPPTSVAPPSSVAPPPVTTTARPAPPTSIVGLDDPPPVPDTMIAAGPLADVVAPPHGCVRASDVAQPVVEGGATTADVLATDTGFLVAAYVGAPEAVAVARIVPGDAPSPIVRVPLEVGDAQDRMAPPVLARVGEAGIAVGVVDGHGGVRVIRFEAGAPAPTPTTTIVTASGADRRYPVALGSVDAGTVVAWTTPVGTSAHVRMAIVSATGTVSDPVDVTPEAGTAAAPVIVASSTPPASTDASVALFTVDARAGISVVHRVAIGADGVPATATVAQPINLAAEPPAFAVVGTHLGYAAVGNGATRAVGVVTMGSEDRAQALVPGLGYGSALTVDAVPLGSAGLFAMEAPSAAEPSAPHETRVRVVGADGAIGDALTIAGTTEPRVAVSGSGGIVAIVGRGAGVWWARCAE